MKEKTNKSKNINLNNNSFSMKLYIICQRYPFFRKLKILLYFFDTIILFLIPKIKFLNNSNKKKIFIIYNYAFGDGLIFLNVFKDIRKIYNRNEYEITLMCQKGLEKIYEEQKVFDIILPYDLIKVTYNLKERYRLYSFLRKEYYDILLDPIGCYECTTNIFISKVVCAKEKISIIDRTLGKSMCPSWIYNRIYDKIIKVSKPNLSLLEYYAEFLREISNKNYQVTLEKKSFKKLDLKLLDKYFIIFPSASTDLKCWPIERYADIAKKVYNKTKIPLLLCGTLNDIDKVNKLIELLEGQVPYINIVDKTSLLEFIEVIKRAKLVVTNDTSTYHIAVINQVPVATITGGYTFDRYVKYDFIGKEKYKSPCYIVHQMKCFNCDNRCKYINKNSKIWPCLDKVNVTNAWKKIEDLIIKETLQQV